MRSENPKLNKKGAEKAPRTKAAPQAAPVKTKPALQVPPILLEGDAAPAPPTSGPGQRYALGPTPIAHGSAPVETGELPEAYGTKRLHLTARDPHWLYAHWDLSSEQLKQYNTVSANR